MLRSNSKGPVGKMLILSYYFPPIKAISSFRNYCLAKYFQDHFEQVDVITTTNDFFLPKEELQLREVKISRIPTLDYRTLFHSEKASGVDDNGSKWHHFFRNLKESFPFNVFLDLGGPFYILFGIVVGYYRIKRSKTTHILSSFRPYADHIIAYCLKRLNPSIYWIADFNNLHFEPDNHPLIWPSLQKRINRWIISKADMVSTVSEGLVSHLRAFNDNVVVLENAIDVIPNFGTSLPNDKFTISYTGSLYPKQSMYSLLSVLKDLIEHGEIEKEKIVLQYAGTSNVWWNKLVDEYELTPINKDLGVLPLKEAQKVMKNSQLNLLLTWTTSGLDGIIPAKFYDYIATEQPILLIINGKKDRLWEEKMDALNAGFVSYEHDKDKDDLSKFILQLYQSWEKGKPCKNTMNKAERNTYFWSYQMPLFVEKLNGGKLTQERKFIEKHNYKKKGRDVFVRMNFKEAK